jgi:peptidoglycan/LPS O-acetylase OafA/YrhL
MQPVAAEGRSAHIAELDGIRGIAILLVLMVHFLRSPGSGLWDEIVKTGWTGVDLFFVLSGFLITASLLTTRERSDYYTVFYVKRTLRIFPLYYCFLAGFVIWNGTPFAQQIWYWVYLGNFRNAFGESIASLNHFWSLAIEEQFYLIWPLVVRRLDNRQLERFCYVLIGGFFAVRYVVVHWPLPTAEFVYTLFRFDSLAFGALIAIWQIEGQLPSLKRRLPLLLLGGCGMFAYGVFRYQTTSFHSPGMERFGYTGMGMIGLSVIAYAILHTGSKPLAVLRSPVLRFFGKYSYGIYVLHLPLYVPLAELDLPVTGFFLAATGISSMLAVLSWHLLEQPFQNQRQRVLRFLGTRA